MPPKRLDVLLPFPDLTRVGADIEDAERYAFERIWMPEGAFDTFTVAGAASQHLRSATLGTSIAVAFARTPMVVAQSAWNLQAMTGGRFVLGLGPQVRGNIERRYGMPWSKPAERMKEFVQAVRAIFARWQDGVELDFRGQFYTHTLMQPSFDPGPLASGAPPIMLAGVGPLMLRTAAEVADGLLMHSLQTENSVRTMTLPALMEGLERSGRRREDLEITNHLMVATGRNEQEIERSRESARSGLAFYASTKAHASVFEAEGLGDLAEHMRGLARNQAWDGFEKNLSDEVLETFVLCGPPETVAREALARSQWADRLVLLPGFGGRDTPQQNLATVYDSFARVNAELAKVD